MRKARMVSKVILRLLKKIVLVVVITLLLSVFLSNFIFSIKLETILEYAGMLLIAIGGLSVLGGRGMTMSRNYQLARTHIEDASMKELELFTESYQFCIFTGISGLIVLLIGAAIHYI